MFSIDQQHILITHEVILLGPFEIEVTGSKGQKKSALEPQGAGSPGIIGN